MTDSLAPETEPQPLTKDERTILLSAFREARQMLRGNTSELAESYVNIALAAERYEATVQQLEAELSAFGKDYGMLLGESNAFEIDRNYWRGKAATLEAELSRSRSPSAKPDEVAWLIERRGDGQMCECGDAKGLHDSFGSVSPAIGRCSRRDCECLTFNPSGVPGWWNGDGWTADHARAIRFARREDAAKVIDARNIGAAKAIEHMWVNRPLTLSETNQ